MSTTEHILIWILALAALAELSRAVGALGQISRSLQDIAAHFGAIRETAEKTALDIGKIRYQALVSARGSSPTPPFDETES